MKRILLHILLLIFSVPAMAQEVFHVFPPDHSVSPGSENGDGSLTRPWDLQTALSQSTEVVNSGDTIWIHEGIYNGRFVSKLKSLEPNKFITVSAFKDDKVILNGNVNSTRNTVLEVAGPQVIFKNFEITWLADFSRDENDSNFQVCSGIRHLKGADCRFYNLNIHDNPGLGIGSWKHAEGTIIENCLIYNNGFMSKDGRGRGEGIYVQNKSDKTRLIKNNIIFNNYYKGIEVWSAGKRSSYEFVKHITLEGNIIFNSGNPSGWFFDNTIIASNDKNGVNIAKHIKVIDNVFYHNTRQPNGHIYGDAPSLTIGFIKRAPVEDVIVDNNVIVGGFNGLRILYSKTLQFSNNKIHTGIVQVAPTITEHYEGWNFNSNVIYSSLTKPYRIPRVKNYALKDWTETFQLDRDSKLFPIEDFTLDPILRVSKHSQNVNKFNVALFNTEGSSVQVDFSSYRIDAGTSYTIYDVENQKKVLKTGVLSEDGYLNIPMQLHEFEKPLHNEKAIKTIANFGVFVVEFDTQEVEDPSPEDKRDNFFTRFWKWLGF